MSIEGYTDYKRREFCKDVKCPMQLEMETLEEGSDEYERLRNGCKTYCKYTTYDFHHWLMEHGYIIVRPR
ncbi:MAG: hypothetical protein ABH868_01290 [bacterium]